MSDFKAEPLFKQISEGLAAMDDKEKKDIQKKVSNLRKSRRGYEKRATIATGLGLEYAATRESLQR